MEESKQINQVIDVLMLAGTLLIESGSEIHRVEATILDRPFTGNRRLQCFSDASRYFLFNRECQCHAHETDLADQLQYRKVCDVNQISRQLVSERSISSKPTKP